MRIETEKIYKLVKKYGGVLTDDRHFMADVDKLLETARDELPTLNSIPDMLRDETHFHERGSMVTDNGQEWFVCKHCHKKYERYF